jgi:formyltetrahydrofolate-dependent phosphoribosylglycinamide formyltransferase
MFKRLQQKWKVGPAQIILIIICFAVGGSATGFAAKKIMNLLSVDADWLWAIIYIVLVTIIWPLAVTVTSIFFGQFKFFSGYVRRLGAKVGLTRSAEFNFKSQTSKFKQELGEDKETSLLSTHNKIAIESKFLTNITIFASGAGSNAEKIIEHFRNSSIAKVALVVCNKPGAGVTRIAEENKVPLLMIEKEKFSRGNGYVDELKQKEIDFIVLAGFLWKIPESLLKAYPKRIINIHPALLPKFGGRGMYGGRVHEAVLSAQERESGITIHYVDEYYDNGDVILQVKCPILENDNAESLAHRIHALEHANYPVVIEELVSQLVK